MSKVLVITFVDDTTILKEINIRVVEGKSSGSSQHMVRVPYSTTRISETIQIFIEYFIF